MTGDEFKVTASALSLRALASASSERLAIIPSAALLTEIDLSPTPGWVNVEWQNQEGFVAAQFLQALAAGDGSTPDPVTAAALGPAPPVASRDSDTGKLHPMVRAAVAATLRILNAEGAPFQVFEAFRTPERQAWLYAQGRTRPGGIVTRSQPWQSYHQYGLAVDLVLRDGLDWSWDASGDKAPLWKRMHALAQSNGLRALDFELPHVEFAGPDWRELQQGRNLPVNGDDAWHDTLATAAARWAASQGQPPGPPLTLAERPPLPDIDPLGT
jgi:D-alanyl-D-alanine carboxypeptidase